MGGGRSQRSARGLSVHDSPIHGQGVFARRAFPKGGMVLEIDDSYPVLDRGALTPEEEVFIDMFVAADGSVKTTRMKSPERLINHSCAPNTYVLTDMRTGVRSTWAFEELRTGDELTWDYAINIWEEWISPVPCNCGAADCRRVIRGNFFTLPREFQRRYLPVLDVPFKKRFAAEIQSLHLPAELGSR